ncbi:hypothetical protein OROGR_006859 [Orobanche gracilis]
MVLLDSSIPVDHHIDMAKPVNPTDPCLKPKQINQFHKKKRNPSSICHQSPYAVIDVVILIAVISACCFLFYPYANILAHESREVMDTVTEEIARAPMVFGCLGLGIFLASMALVVVSVCADSRCGKPGCRGRPKGSTGFDIQLETEEEAKTSSWSSSLEKNGLKKGLFEVHHKELEAELRKLAPPNGRAVLVFRARCGCSVGRMEVLGPRKYRKINKK